MKKRKLSNLLRPSGILRWSTACLLAGGLSGCDRTTQYTSSPEDARMAATQSKLDKLDAEKAKLMNGEVSNNFFIDRVGYYHVPARQFFDHPYGLAKDGRYFANGKWQDTAPPQVVSTSRPSPEALKKVELALEQEQKELAANGKAGQQNQSGFGMGNALMMYWLLSGNRGLFSPGAGFTQAGQQAGNWQRGVENQRGVVNRYAASNPGYQRMVDQSRATGRPVAPGQSVRGGFGSRSSGGSSFGG